jgi:hypothetical protein
MYGFFVKPVAYAAANHSLFVATGTALLVLIGTNMFYLGFGLVFSYVKNMPWSGLGFTFLITVLTFQYYFLINGFWSKVQIQDSTTKFLDDDKNVYVFMSDENGNNINTLDNTATQAFKCSLSMAVAFACFSGRAGPLSALILVIIGTVFYELNRQIISNISVDYGGSMSIFCFGGFLGSAASLVLYFSGQRYIIKNHQ